jgi:hypothetical protein
MAVEIGFDFLALPMRRARFGSHYVRDAAFAEDASRIRKNADIAARLRSFAYNLIRASGEDNIQNARYRAALDLSFAINLLSRGEN